VRVQGVIFGVIPQVLPLWNSFALYLFETNVRSAMTLGIVRTGGIGLTSTKAFAPHYADTAAQVIVVVVAVFIIDLVTGAGCRTELVVQRYSFVTHLSEPCQERWRRSS